MMDRRLAAALLTLLAPAPLLAEPGALAITADEAAKSYTITEGGRPVLTYRFGEVPLPPGVPPSHFGKGAAPYDGAYFTDGSPYGGPRSNYIHPLYGFHGEPLTADFPRDHLHHRGLWWSWCEVRHHGKIGDLWAVCKIRAYPVKLTRQEARAGEAVLQAVNAWRYDDEPTPVVNETVTIRAARTTGSPGARRRTIDVDVRLEALADGVAIAGRQKVDYGGYGGLTVRLHPGVKDYSLRAVHPGPDRWQGDDLKFAERLTDPARFGDAAWLALSGKYPAPGVADPGVTTLLMFESKATPLSPNQFRYYPTTCTSLAFPGKKVLPLPKGRPVDYRTRIVLVEGRTTPEQELAAWQAYQR